MAEDERKSASYTPDVEPRPASKRLPSNAGQNHGEDAREETPGTDAEIKQEKDKDAASASGDAEEPKSEKRRSESGGKDKPAGNAAGAKPSAGVKRATTDEEAYEKVKKHLRELVAKKANIDRELEDTEERLFVEEGAYLQDASAGNVAKGFEHYTKGSQNRRKSVLGDQDRVFSVSSTSFDAES